jgi:hypothetical protein
MQKSSTLILERCMGVVAYTSVYMRKMMPLLWRHVYFLVFVYFPRPNDSQLSSFVVPTQTFFSCFQKRCGLGVVMFVSMGFDEVVNQETGHFLWPHENE